MSNAMKYLSMAMSMSAMAGDLFYPDNSNKKINGVYRSVRTEQKINRNEQCPCGSGKKYKKCCLGANEM